jgi:hypothetical protein
VVYMCSRQLSASPSNVHGAVDNLAAPRLSAQPEPARRGPALATLAFE